MKRINWRLILPLLVLVALALLFMRGLWLDPKKLPSTRVGQAAPAFSLPDLYSTAPVVHTPDELKGKVWLLNVFASWCSACVTEHPVWLEFARQTGIPVIGLAYKDDTQATKDWLAERGNPYRWIAVDRDGRVAINYGVYGVPETFLIDTKGVIRYRHVGPVDNQFFQEQVRPVVMEAVSDGQR